MHVVELDRLTKYYGKTRGIEEVTLQVEEGEIFGFIGPNGAGKSTTIRTMLGLIFPTSGGVKLFGEDALVHGSALRRGVGYLPSEVFYYDRMKVRDLLSYAASFHDKDCSARIRELSDLMELDLDRRIEDLSYGNRKKVGIVQGLLHTPKLIILDEPTSGLDPLMQQKFFQLIQEENQRGATVFFSSHILSEVQELCNRVAIIKEGRIIELQDMKTLRSDTYKKVTVRGPDLGETDFQFQGVTELKSMDRGFRFFYKGEVPFLVQRLSQMEITDLMVAEPSLEEIFLHYYAR